jgi:hypothetical protein
MADSSFANQCVALSQNRAGCRRRFGRTWANLLKNKGDFVILVNGSLTPQAAKVIKDGCAFAATFPGRSAAPSARLRASSTRYGEAE